MCIRDRLSVSHLTGVTPRSQKNITMFMAVSYIGHKLCYPGDLVLNTMWAWVGAVSFIHPPAPEHGPDTGLPLLL